MTEEPKTETQAAFRYGIAAAGERYLENHPYYVNPITGQPESLARLLDDPLHIEVHREFQTTEDLIAYVNRFKEHESSIYLIGTTLTVEFDHYATGLPKWRHHKASRAFKLLAGMQAWISSAGKALSQEDFASLIETRASDIIRPESAAMVELAQELHITRQSAVSSITRQGAHVAIKYSDDQKVRGRNEADIPATFEIRLRPYLGSDVTVTLTARLRVRVVAEKVAITYEIDDLSERLLEAMTAEVRAIASATDLPAYI